MTTKTRTSHGASQRCAECGRPGARMTHDMSGIGGYACRRCDDGSLSFA